MNEHESHHFHAQDAHLEQAPSSLMPTLLARLGLNGSEPVPETSLAVLRTALNSPEWTVRINAVQELEHVRDQEASRLLFIALNDEDGSVRACAIRVLGVRNDLSKRVVLEQLEAALHDKEWHVRETAVNALAALDDQTSLAALRDALHDTDDAVQDAALQAIQHLQHTTGSTEPINGWPDSEPALSSSQSFIGMWSQNMRRFALHLRPHLSTDTEKDLTMLEEIQDVKTEYPSTPTKRKFGAKRFTPPQQDRQQRRLTRVLEQGLAAVLILAILMGWFALSHLSHSSSGSPSTGAPALGKPVAMVQGNFRSPDDWSSDGHTFISLQVNTQKHELAVRMLDAATGRSILYPVLDSSWISTIDLGTFVTVLEGRYLLALRAHGANQATLEIWDIIGKRAVITQTVPAQIAGNGQVMLPRIEPSANQQKFAMYSPDGTIAIWDVASGQKQVTCEGKFLLSQLSSVTMQWYNHDQDLLVSIITSTTGNGKLEAWNAITGTHLFDPRLFNPTHEAYPVPIVSPDNKYMALNSTPDTLEILDAYSGQVLHSYHPRVSGFNESFDWLPDSQHLVVTTIHDSKLEQVNTWNAFTNQVTPIVSTFPSGTGWPMANGQYIVQYAGPDGSTWKIWQTSNGHQVATINEPGIPARTAEFTADDNQYLVIGHGEDFYIWRIATGKLLYSYHGPTPFSPDAQNGGGMVVKWSPNGKYLAMVEVKDLSIGEGSLAIWRMP